MCNNQTTCPFLSSQSQSGIVYCLSRKDCEQVCAELAAAGLAAAYYHADLDPADRQRAHGLWSNGQVKVSKQGFGLGVGLGLN